MRRSLSPPISRPPACPTRHGVALVAQALIVPPGTKVPWGYQVVYENSKLCGGGTVSAHLEGATRPPPKPRIWPTAPNAVHSHSPTWARPTPCLAHHDPAAENFYVPGTKSKSWNKEWPVLRIMMRHEDAAQLALLPPAGAGGGALEDGYEFELLLDCTVAAAAQAATAQHYGSTGYY